MKPRALKPSYCAVRRHNGGESTGRCWRYVGKKGRCPVHGDVTGVQFRFKQTGELTNDNDLQELRAKVMPLASEQVEYGTKEWVERFRLANPRAEVVGFRGVVLLIKIKPADGDFPRIFVVTGGTPERPTLSEY